MQSGTLAKTFLICQSHSTHTVPPKSQGTNLISFSYFQSDIFLYTIKFVQNMDRETFLWEKHAAVFNRGGHHQLFAWWNMSFLNPSSWGRKKKNKIKRESLQYWKLVFSMKHRHKNPTRYLGSYICRCTLSPSLSSSSTVFRRTVWTRSSFGLFVHN